MKLGVYEQLNEDGETTFRQLALYDFETDEWIAGADGVVRSLPAEPEPEDFDERYGGRRSRRIVAEPGDLNGPIRTDDATEASSEAIETTATATEREIMEWNEYMEEHEILPPEALPDDYTPRPEFANEFYEAIKAAEEGDDSDDCESD